MNRDAERISTDLRHSTAHYVVDLYQWYITVYISLNM